VTTAAFEGVEVVLLDIEGTTTPISFVYDVLFPYARKHLQSFLSRRGQEPEVARAVAGLEDEPLALMERDSKSPALKALQGMIWQEGYASGELRGVVFDDVPEALRRWRAAGIRAAIYSSGSMLAQRLIFSTTQFGDLTPQLDGFFDTDLGPKREASSYGTIARKLGAQAPAILFVSDVMAELVAARQAGYQVALVTRPGNQSQQAVGSTPVVRSLLELPLTLQPG
jgi:enolase-phosphatase E1